VICRAHSTTLPNSTCRLSQGWRWVPRPLHRWRCFPGAPMRPPGPPPEEGVSEEHSPGCSRRSVVPGCSHPRGDRYINRRGYHRPRWGGSGGPIAHQQARSTWSRRRLSRPSRLSAQNGVVFLAVRTWLTVSALSAPPRKSPSRPPRWARRTASTSVSPRHQPSEQARPPSHCQLCRAELMSPRSQSRRDSWGPASSTPRYRLHHHAHAEPVNAQRQLSCDVSVWAPASSTPRRRYPDAQA